MAALNAFSFNACSTAVPALRFVGFTNEFGTVELTLLGQLTAAQSQECFYKFTV
jgi:hypothetical protein